MPGCYNQATRDPADHNRTWQFSAWFLLGLFTAVGLSLQWYYILRNGRPLTYDDAWYLENSLNLYHRLSHDGLLPFLAAYTKVFGIKAPLIAVLPLPFFVIHGPQLQSALAINSVFLVAVNLYLFAVGSRWYSPGVGLLSVVVFQTMPVAIGMSRAFMTEYGEVALTIAFVYYLMRSDGLQVWSANFALGVIGGLGLLMKITFPAIVLAPFLVTWNHGRGKRRPVERSRFAAWYSRRPVVSILITAGAIASTWYPFHFLQIVGFSLLTSYGEISTHYQVASLWVWLRDMGSLGISSFYTLVLLLCLIGELMMASAKRGQAWSHRSTMLLSWFLPSAAAVFLGHQQDPRHALVALPPLAIWIASRAGAAMASLRAPVAALFAAIFVAIPILGAVALTFPAPASGHGFRAGPFLFFGRDLWWAHPPDRRGDWGQAGVLEALKGIPAPRPSNVIVGVEHPYFNANLLGYMNAIDDGPFRFMSFGFNPDTPFSTALARAVDRIHKVKPRFIIMVEGFRDDELEAFLNRLNGRVREMLDRGELPFRRRLEIRLTETVKAEIYEAVTSDE